MGRLQGEKGGGAHLDFRALLHLVLLGYRVCDYHCLKTGVVDPRDCRPRKDPMS